MGGFSFARRISPILGALCGFFFSLYPTIAAAFPRFIGLYSRPAMHTFQRGIARKYTNNKAPKIFSKNFSDFVTNAVPHGVTTERRTTAAATSSTAPDKTERMPRTGKSSESYNALDDVGPKEIRAVGVGNRRPHEHIRKSCENVKATDYVMQEMAP